MDKLDMQTKNLAEEKYEALKNLFPNAVTETINENGELVKAIDKDILMQEISSEVVEGREERYQFTWPDKRNAILTANAPISKTLRPCREESVNFDQTENLYIEGDNLEVLKLLQETYLDTIDVIYIDPPYNTGNDFVYNDVFKKNTEEYLEHSGQYDDDGNRLEKNQESNGRFHTDWLNMMYPRLKLARNLLSKNGVIFISIDDNELVNLKKICDEIFGESCDVGTLVWHKKTQPSYLSKEIATIKEYILFYKKKQDITIETFGGFTDVNKNIEMINISNSIDQRILVKENVLVANGKYTGILKAGIYGKGQLRIELKNDVSIVEGIPEQNLKLQGRFKWSQKLMGESFEKGDIFHIKNIKSLRPTVEKRDKVARIKPTIDILSKKFDKNIATNTDANNEMKKLFNGTKTIDYPKPVKFIKYLLNSIIYNSSDAIVLDFFSGSSTTAHAVMQLNSEDGGNRKFIMVQLQEETDEKSEAFKVGYETIAEIGKERIRRAGKKILEENQNKEGIENLDIGFRVLKTDTSNMKDVFYSPANIEQNLLDMLEDNIKEDRSPEDLLFQVMLDLGISLSSKIKIESIGGKQVYMVEDNFLIACFDKDVNEETVKEIAKREPYYAVFRDASMASDSVATNFDQIFESISPETIRRVV